ncbi:nucleic acid-binding, OB-fold-like protein [Actinidia rufa]|uniref:Nucleic acid-binding, OB-fold-like protein n=1 Tax=Actinidia rufa TaxID=165716 RepID=A0A7J0ED97_9ERIC|nr:nucleic acid-binding, OB-fold-like protein [Actinidia rufa]
MAITSQSIVSSRNQLIVSALCKRLNLNPKNFHDDVLQGDIKSLCTKILMSSQSGNTLESNGEVTKWIAFAEKFPENSEAHLSAYNELNGCLASKSVLVGEGLTPSEADIIVFSAIYSYVNKDDFGERFEQILVEKDKFEPPEKVTGDSQAKTEKKKLDSQTTIEKKKLPEKAADEKDKDTSVSLLKIQVGLIRKAWKHPSADSLLVEEIDTGDAKLRQVVSGLAKYCSPDELTNRRVVLITNVKPGKLRDVMSEGLVLCASNEDHTIVEPLTPPESAKIGECVSFSGHEGKPEDVLNPKKKQLEKITPHLFTDDKGVATFKGIPFMTSGGPCTSSIPKASIK